jgi:hypothetical protein
MLLLDAAVTCGGTAQALKFPADLMRVLKFSVPGSLFRGTQPQTKIHHIRNMMKRPGS